MFKFFNASQPIEEEPEETGPCLKEQLYRQSLQEAVARKKDRHRFLKKVNSGFIKVEDAVIEDDLEWRSPLFDIFE